MKAAEVMRLYEAGQRDFSGESLRGENFKGKDLAGADFSGADIRSTNFTNANLTKTNFTHAKAGLQRRWMIGLLIGSLLVLTVSGFFSAVVGDFVALIFKFPNRVTTNTMLGWMILVIIVNFAGISYQKSLATGFTVICVNSVLAVAITLTVVFSVGLSTQVTGALSIAIAGAVVVSVTTSLSVAVVLIMVGSGVLPVALALAGLGFSYGTLRGPEYLDGALFSSVAGALLLVSVYVGWRAWKGGEQDAWICSIAVTYAAIGGTSLRGSILTDANFSQAYLSSTDFRRAVLLRTRLRGAEKLDRVRSGETYLNNSKIRELLITGNGQGQTYDHLLNLSGINLQDANLVKADFTGSNLKDGLLRGANLANASLIGTNLNCAYLQDTDLSNAKLVQTQLDEADLTGSTLTGACIEDWNITTRTKLNGIRCDYVFMRLLSDRRQDQNPHRKPDDWDKNFADGEFVDFIAPMVQTLDLYHNGKVDPRALAISYHDLQQQYPEADLEIVSMEKRGQYRDKFLLRATTSPSADLSTLHSKYFERYEHLLTLSPQALVALLMEKEEKSQMLAGLVGTAITQPKTQINKTYQGDTTVSEQGSNAPKYDLSNAQFGGGYVAGNVEGNQYGGIIHNYGPNTEDITRLLTALRDQLKPSPLTKKTTLTTSSTS